MTASLIPLRNDAPFFDVRVILSEDEYVLSFNWNERESAWYMSLFDSLSVPIKEGVRLSVGNALLRSLTYSPRRPPGDFIVLDTSNKDIDPGLTDLGQRVIVVYDDSFPVTI